VPGGVGRDHQVGIWGGIILFKIVFVDEDPCIEGIGLSFRNGKRIDIHLRYFRKITDEIRKGDDDLFDLSEIRRRFPPIALEHLEGFSLLHQSPGQALVKRGKADGIIP